MVTGKGKAGTAFMRNEGINNTIRREI